MYLYHWKDILTVPLLILLHRNISSYNREKNSYFLMSDVHSFVFEYLLQIYDNLTPISCLNSSSELCAS